MREFRIIVEVPEKDGGVFYDEIDHITQDNYPDEVDIKYIKQLAVDLWPEATFVQVYELAEEIKLRGNK